MSLSKIAIVIGIMVPLAVVTSIVQAAAAQGRILQWSRPINVSNTDNLSRFVRIAPDIEGTLHAVWSENVDTDSGAWGNAIYYSQFKQGRWSNPVDVVYNGTMAAHLPSIAASRDGDLSLIWTDTYRLYYQHARAQAAKAATGWSSPKTISFGGQERTYWSDIVVEGDTIHVFWSGGQKGTWDVFYVRSVDGGLTWTTPMQITDTPNIMETRPRAAIDEKANLHLVWAENQISDAGISIRYARSENGGLSWTSPLRVANIDGVAGAPVIVTGSHGLTHIIWQQGWGTTDKRNFGICDRASKDSGKSWERVMRVGDGYGGTVPLSATIDVSDSVHLVWQQETGYPEIGLFYSTWSEGSWSSPIQIAKDQGDARPQIAITEGNRLNVVWAKSKPDEVYDILHISAVTDAPVVPTRLFPKLEPARQPTGTLTPVPTRSPTLTLIPSPAPLDSSEVPTGSPQSAWLPMLAGVLPIILLIVATMGVQILRLR